MSWFERNTPVMDAIDQATSEGHSSEDIGFHLEICDMINTIEGCAKDAAKSLKRKLVAKTAPATLVKALIVLETCVKNCGRPFHMQVTERTFCDVLFKLVSISNNGRGTIGGLSREKALGMIQSWADAFRHDTALGGLRELYVKLLGEGIEFPAQNLDALAPIITPQMTAPAPLSPAAAAAPGPPPTTGAQTDEELARELDRQFRMEDEAAAQTAQQDQQQAAAMQQMSTQMPSQAGFPPQVAPPQVAPPQAAVPAAAAAPPAPRRTRIEYVPQHIQPGERVIVTPEQLVKVRADLAIVKQNTSLLQDLLRNLGPDEKVKDNELINDIAETCEQMQNRVMKLCEQVDNEDLIVELFVVNDVLNDAQNMFKLRATQESALEQARGHGQQKQPIPPVRGAVPGPAAGGAVSVSVARLMGVGQEDLPAYDASSYMSEPPSPLVSLSGGPAALGALQFNDDGSSAASDGLSPPPFDMFAQTRDISMADQLKMGPGYVTGNESTMEEHAVYGDEQDASLGAALYSHTHAVSAAFGDVPQHTASGQDEGSFMGTSSLFSQPAPAAGGSSSGAAELLIDLGQGADSGGANTSGYMEIQPVASSKPSGGGGGGGGNPDLLLGPLDPLADFDVDGDNSSDGYMTVQPPQGPLIDVGGPPEINRNPTIYGDGQIRQLSERDRRNLEQQQDSMFDL